MSQAIMDTMAVDLVHGDVIFRANGSKIKFPGFMKIYVEGNDDGTDVTNDKKDTLLPDLHENDAVTSEEIEPKQHFTQPPPRYSEARLVKVLEELGIGRPSTYAPTLETIQRRGYVALENKRFIPTELGVIVIQLISEFFPEIINVEFTAKMEKDLDEIEDGRENWVKIIDEFYKDFRVRLEVAEKEMEEVEIEDEPAGEDCENCGNPMVIKWDDMGNLWHAVIFQIVEIRKRLLRKLV